MFNEVTHIEKAIFTQLSKALPELYLKRFRNVHLNTITSNIPTVLEDLFTTYGNIEPELLDNKKEQLEAKVFDTTEPLAILFNEVEDLLALSTAASNPYTSRQIVNLGVKLIKKFNEFEKSLEGPHRSGNIRNDHSGNHFANLICFF